MKVSAPPCLAFLCGSQPARASVFNDFASQYGAASRNGMKRRECKVKPLSPVSSKLRLANVGLENLAPISFFGRGEHPARESGTISNQTKVAGTLL